MSTLTTISASDKVSDSRAVINDNFTALNTDKIEAGSTETLTNKTLTSPIINTGISGTAFLDEDDMASNSATKVASQQSIKAYVDSGTVTMTNKTLTTPVINGAFTGTATPPKTFYATNFNAPEGFLINGKIVPSVASNNLTVAVKGMDGNDPSVTNPVYCRINGTVRAITAALSVTNAAGTNWCNSGATEHATKEIDYFVYLGYNATDGVVIGFSRYPGANSYDDFSATSTNEKYCAISTIANAAATDYYHVIGRFAATLSAGAGYTWSVPTYTASNLVQRPIYETRKLTYAPTYTASGSMQYNSVTNDVVEYKLSGHACSLQIQAHGTVAGTPALALKFSLPISGASRYSFNGGGVAFDNGATLACVCGNLNTASTTVLDVYKYNASNWTAGTAYIGVGLTYEI